MSKGPRPWPDNALHARDDSAEFAMTALKRLIPIIDQEPMTELERQTILTQVVNDLYCIVLKLYAVGAPVDLSGIEPHWICKNRKG